MIYALMVTVGIGSGWSNQNGFAVTSQKHEFASQREADATYDKIAKYEVPERVTVVVLKLY